MIIYHTSGSVFEQGRKDLTDHSKLRDCDPVNQFSISPVQLLVTHSDSSPCTELLLPDAQEKDVLERWIMTLSEWQSQV